MLHSSYVKPPTDRIFLVKVHSAPLFIFFPLKYHAPQMADTDEYLKPSSLAALETDVNFTEHIVTHISPTHHHLTGAPEPPEPPYAPFFHPPTGYWPPKKPSSSAR
jgi:hypothetical protein